VQRLSETVLILRRIQRGMIVYIYIYIYIYIYREREREGHCATSRKVAGSILDGVIAIFH